MQNDRITLRDLSIFPADGSGGVFALIDRTTTQEGAAALRRMVTHPPDNYERLQQVQGVVKFWAQNADLWPRRISNGTLVMLEKFYESADSASPPPKGLAAIVMELFQKTLNRREYFFTKFSLSHLSDLLHGCRELVSIADERDNIPALLRTELDAMREELGHRLAEPVMAVGEHTGFAELSRLQYQARREMKNTVYRLIATYARLDALHAMGRATQEHGWTFPVLGPEAPILFEARGIYHPLLNSPVSYDMAFGPDRNFLLLTGANMSGKTTFLRALGVAALLAHLGMGVPAAAMRISFLHGIVTNMHTEDNLLKGESYFFAEVQRMKEIARQLLQKETHLVLMDELFKGTNVHDAYECTRAVIDGLMSRSVHIMALSTHLYEVAQQFAADNRVLFSYFVTNISDEGNYSFTYQLKEGISNDRIGYIILQKEGVIGLLQRLQD